MCKIITLDTDQTYTMVRKEYTHPLSGVQRDLYFLQGPNPSSQEEDEERIQLGQYLAQEGFHLTKAYSLSVTIGKLTMENVTKQIENSPPQIAAMIDTFLEKFHHRVLTATFNIDLLHHHDPATIRRSLLPVSQRTAQE